MEVIYRMNAEETEEKDLDKIVEKVSEDINEYNLKYDNLQSAHAATLEGADKLLHQKPTPATQKESSGNPTRFNSYPDLKPTFLNQDSTMIEINQWCNQLTNYLNMGYNGNPPAMGTSIHLAPLMHSSWTQAIETKNLEDKSVRELTEIIKEEGKLRMPVHQRRLQLLKARRNQTKHTEFIFQLEKLMSVAEFDRMNSDEIIIHLFVETADSTMPLKSCQLRIRKLLT
jgi:hypothetical protein